LIDYNENRILKIKVKGKHMTTMNKGRGTYAYRDVDYGMYGLVIGDALGVPVEFCFREELRIDPVTDMRGYGTYKQPVGTWSDDSSLALALADSLSGGQLDYESVMANFIAWYNDAAYTSGGLVFDIGGTTKHAIMRGIEGVPALECGGKDKNENGNGSLMRILPIVFYLKSSAVPVLSDLGIEIIGNVSALTHAHPISKFGCIVYCKVAEEICRFRSRTTSYETDDKNAVFEKIIGRATKEAFSRLSEVPEYKGTEKQYIHILDQNFKDTPLNLIDSGGYVVETLTTALWCLLNTHSYKEALLKAVNLGHDTDTVGAVCGGLAGLFYRSSDDIGIPNEWLNAIADKDQLEQICEKLNFGLRLSSTVEDQKSHHE
jgi:ADP-ribosylglycohydrolase